MPGLQLVDRPVFPPSKCVACGGGHNKRCIDTGVDLSMPHGQVYICEDCGEEIAHLLHFVSGEAAAKMVQTIDELETRVGELTGELEQTRPVVEAVRQVKIRASA